MLVKPSGSSVRPDPNPSALTLKGQALLWRNKKARRRKEATNEWQLQAKVPQNHPPTTSPYSQSAFPSYHNFVTCKWRRFQFCATCGRITALVVTAIVRIRPMYQLALIFENCEMDFWRSSRRDFYNPTILNLRLYEYRRVLGRKFWKVYEK